MHQIWKYELEVTDLNEIFMPEGADVLAVQTQKNTPCLWAKVDPDAPQVLRAFRTIGTGYTFEKSHKYNRYIGTYQLAGGSFIGHVFEVT